MIEKFLPSWVFVLAKNSGFKPPDAWLTRFPGLRAWGEVPRGEPGHSIPILEKKIDDYPAFQEHKRRVSAFWPMSKKRN